MNNMSNFLLEIEFCIYSVSKMKLYNSKRTTLVIALIPTSTTCKIFERQINKAKSLTAACRKRIPFIYHRKKISKIEKIMSKSMLDAW